MLKKPFDPIRAPLVKQLFEKYAEGIYSLADLARWANEQGLTMQPARRPRTLEEKLSDEKIVIEPISRMMNINVIQKTLKNPFYIGLVLGNDKVHIKSISHEALIDEDLFYRVQSMLKSKRVSVYYARKPYFPYRGLVRCNDCYRSYSPYAKGEVHYYGARCRKDCPNSNKSINGKFIENKIGEAIGNLSFTEEQLIEIDTRIRNEIGTLDRDRSKETNIIQNKKRKLREDLAYLHTNKLSLLKTQAYSTEEYLVEESRINKALGELHAHEESLDVSMHEVIKDVVLLSEMLINAGVYYFLANPSEKAEIIKKVFSEITISGNTLKYKARNGFKVLETKEILLGDRRVWLSELVSYSQYITVSIKDLQMIAV